MAATAQEIERKYEAGPAVTLPGLSGVQGVAQETDLPSEDLSAEYYDTDDLRLIRAGVTLRRRRGGHDAGWHLKLPAGADTRQEIRLPLGRAGRRVPAELATLVRGWTRGAALGPVAQIGTIRQRRALLDGSGASLAEVAIDEVSAQSMGDPRHAVRVAGDRGRAHRRRPGPAQGDRQAAARGRAEPCRALGQAGPGAGRAAS